MKTKKIILFGIVNLVALIIILATIEHIVLVNKYSERFRSNSFIMNDSVQIDRSANEIYQFYIHHYPEIYHRTAEKHHEFKLLNSDSIVQGTKIYCREGEQEEMIIHQYVVNQVIPNRLIYKSSEPSTIKTKTGKGYRQTRCNSFVYVDFKEISKNKSSVGFTIAIQMPNYFYKLAGRILGGKKAKEEWENHLREELIGFKQQFLLAIN